MRPRNGAVVAAAVASITAVAAAPAPASASSSGSWGSTNYAVGQSGNCPSYAYHSGVGVVGWQANLWAAREFSGKSSIDGAFGNDSTAKTQHWQKTRGLNPPDGCVGSASWNKGFNEKDYVGGDANGGHWKYRPVDDDHAVDWFDFYLCHYVSFNHPVDGSRHYTYVTTYDCSDWRDYVETGTQAQS